MVAESLAKQNFSNVCEDAINQQIQMYQMAQQTYLAASAYFDKADVALPVSFQLVSHEKSHTQITKKKQQGFVKYFHERAQHEGKLARDLIDYQITRGGVCIITAIPQPLVKFGFPFYFKSR